MRIAALILAFALAAAATVAWTSKALDGQPVRLQLARGR